MHIKKENLSGKLWRILQCFGLVIVVATVALLVECVVFQRNAIKYKQQPYELIGLNQDGVTITNKDDLVPLTADEENAIMVHRENERLLAEYHGEEYVPEEDETLVEEGEHFFRKVKRMVVSLDLEQTYFVGTLGVYVPLEENGGYQVTLLRGEKVIGKNMFCSIHPKIDAGIMNVGKLADHVELTLTTEEEINPKDIILSIRNDFTINWMRLLFLFVLFGSTVFLLVEAICSKWMTEHPALVFAVLAFLIGSIIICGVGTNQVGFDEYTHAKAAYDLSYGATIETTEAAMQLKGNLLPFFNNAKERELVEAYEQRVATEIAPDITHQSRNVRTETRVYYPMAAGFYIGRMLHLDFAWLVMFAKFGNLICYIMVFALAIHLAKQYKLLVMLIGLLPNNLFIASSITYDAIVTAFLMLGTVLMLNEILEPVVKLSWGKTLLMLFAFEIGCLSKPIYIFMVLLLLFVSKDKFHTRWQEVIFKLSLVALAGVMLYNIFRPTPVAGGDYALVSNLSYAGDPRNTGASVIGQIQYIMNNPLDYTKLLLGSMGGMLADYLTCKLPFVGYAYLGFAPAFVNYVMIAIAAIATLFTARERQYYVVEDKRWFKRSAIGLKFILLTLLMCFGVTAVIWTSMYVSYTAVASPVILGVQGRYFIPLFLPFFSCFFFKRPDGKEENTLSKLWNRIPARVMYSVLVFGMVIINLIMSYQFIIVKCNQ